MSQVEVARAIGTDYTTICRWELGDRAPTLDQVRQLVCFYDVEFNALLSPQPQTGDERKEILAELKKMIAQEKKEKK